MSISLNPEVIRLLLVLAATLAAHFTARRILRHAEKIAARTNNIWDDSQSNTSLTLRDGGLSRKMRA